MDSSYFLSSGSGPDVEVQAQIDPHCGGPSGEPPVMPNPQPVKNLDEKTTSVNKTTDI